MKKINYKSDFDFILRLTDCKGVNIGFPDFDWEAKFYTNSKANAFVASSRNGETVNCFNDEGQIHVVVDEHKMGIGNLNVEMHMELPNDIYPDGVQNDVQPMPLDIELVSGQGDCPTTAEIEVRLPYINGNGNITDELLAYIKKEIDKKADRTELSNIIGDPTEQEIENISPTLVTEALRKVPQLLTPDEQEQVKQNIGVSKMELFIDLWNTACGIWGRYNKETGYFELNGITDITYEDAVKIYEAGPLIDSLQVYSDGVFSTIRTNLPSKRKTGLDYKPRSVTIYTQAFHANLEIVNLNPANSESDLYIDNNSEISHYSFWAKRYIGVCNLTRYNKNFNCLSNPVEHLFIRCLHTNAEMRGALLDLESMSFLIAEATNTSAITITVKRQVYDKLTDETNTEWHQVLLDAADKNITFATI